MRLPLSHSRRQQNSAVLKLVSILVLVVGLGFPVALYDVTGLQFGVRYPRHATPFAEGAKQPGKAATDAAHSRCGAEAQIRQGLRSEPLSPEMLWCWSLIDEGNTGDAALQLAARISRRNMQVEAALLKRAAEKGDAAGALVHVDRILRVFPEAGGEILPGLAGLMGTGEGRALLAPYVGRPWFLHVASQAVSRKIDAGAIAVLLSARKGAGASLPKDMISILIGKMLERSEISRAMDWVAGLAGRPVGALDHFGLSPFTVDQVYAPLTWKIPARRDVSGAYRRDGMIEFLAAPDSFVTLLERVTAYEPGTYSFEQKARMNSGDLTLEWVIHCNGSGRNRPFWRKPLSAGAVRQEAIRVTVEEGCRQQKWLLRANTNTSAWPMSIAIGFGDFDAISQ